MKSQVKVMSGQGQFSNKLGHFNVNHTNISHVEGQKKTH